MKIPFLDKFDLKIATVIGNEYAEFDTNVHLLFWTGVTVNLDSQK